MTFFKTSLIFLLFPFCSAYNDIFNEELLLNPLPNGHIYTYFQFTTKWEANLKEGIIHFFNDENLYKIYCYKFIL